MKLMWFKILFVVILLIDVAQATRRRAAEINLGNDESIVADDSLLKCLEARCSYQATKPYELKVHMRVHTGERPYKCTFCDKWFKRVDQRRSHERIHANHRPYVCEQCDAGFKQQSHLNVHTKIHTGERPYKCDVAGCKEAYASLAYLRDHQQKHTGIALHVCVECGAALANAASLSRHVKMVHDGEKPFSCVHCPAVFRSDHSLQIHIAAHTLKHAFKCHVCCLSYSRKRDITLHNKRYHTDIGYDAIKADLLAGPGLDDLLGNVDTEC